MHGFPDMKISAPIAALLLIAAGSTYGQTIQDDLALTASEVKALGVDAENGNPSAAVRLGSYFEFKRADLQTAEHWYQIAAENGDTSAMRDLWRFNQESEDPSDRRRGLFWLKKSASLGDKTSLAELERLRKKGDGD